MLALVAVAAGEEPSPVPDAAAAAAAITEINDVHAVGDYMMAHEKVILLLYAKGCERAESFLPTLATIAEKVPSLAYGRVDVVEVPNMNRGAKFPVQPGAPALKAYFRNAPVGKRVLMYSGSPALDEVLAWCQAIASWDGAEPPDGWQAASGSTSQGAAPAADVPADVPRSVDKDET